MCYNCGCGIPDDDMGSADNITNSTLYHLGEHWKMNDRATKEKVLAMLDGKEPEDNHVTEMFKKASEAWGQSEEEARRETKHLLEKVLKSDNK